jgi:hypothetical protein
MLGVRLLFGGVWAAFIPGDVGKRLFSDGHAMSAIEMRIASPPSVKRVHEDSIKNGHFWGSLLGNRTYSCRPTAKLLMILFRTCSEVLRG